MKISLEIAVFSYGIVLNVGSFGQSVDVTVDYQGNQVNISCGITPFSGTATWSNDDINVIATCFNTPPCTVASGAPSYATFSSDGSGMYVTINPFDNNVALLWICQNKGIKDNTTLLYTSPTSPPSSDSRAKLITIIIIIAAIVLIVIVMIVIYCCSNKNCKTHEKCWCCKETFYSDFPTASSNSSRVKWNIDHYKSSGRSCRKNVCNNRCCLFFLCRGCCLKELPARRYSDEENGQTLTENDTRRKSFDSTGNQIHPDKDGKGDNTR